MSAACGYELKPSLGYPTPGSLGSYAGRDLAIATITLELPDAGSAEQVWKELSGALELFVTF
jgi:protein MpaA